MSSTNVGSIYYDLSVDTSKFDNAVDKVASSTKSLGDKLASIGKTMTAAITLPVAAGFAYMIKSASDLNETINKVDEAFKDQSDGVKKWAKDSINSMGLAQGSALDAVALFGDMSTAMGLTTNQAAAMSTELVQLGADLASFKNISFAEAQTALAGIFTGETESLKRLGIVMTDANVQAYALSKGITKNISTMTQAEKVQLRYAYVMDVTKNAQGDFNRTSNGTANQLRITSEKFKELSASLGQQLLPLANKLLTWAQGMISWFRQLAPEQQRQIMMFAGIAAVVGPLLIVFGSLIGAISSIATGIGAATTAIKFLWVAISTHPIGALITALALAAGGLLAYKTGVDGAKQSTDGLKIAQDNLKVATDNVKAAEQTLTDARLAKTGSDIAVQRAQERLTELMNSGEASALDLREAEYNLQVAMDAAKDAANRETNALTDLHKKQSEQGSAQTVVNNEIQKKDHIDRTTNSLHDQLNAFTDLINTGYSLNGKTFTYNIKGISTKIGEPIGANAGGTDNWRGGLTWVGEKGPEIVNLPKGSQVIPNNKIRSNSNTSIYGNITIGSQSDADYFFSRLDRNQDLTSMGMAGM